MPGSPYQGSEIVSRKLRGWSDALIDLTRRNPLLSLPSRSILPITAQPPDELYKLLTGSKPKALSFVTQLLPFTEQPRALKAGQVSATDAELKLLNNLRLKAQLSLTEQGINVLFVVLGVLEWPDPKTQTVLRSPLLLVPASLERLTGNEGFTLGRFEDEVRVNPTLRHRLSQPDIAFSLPDRKEDDEASPSAYLDLVARAVAGRPGWKVHASECLIGRFSYLKQVMYEDLISQAGAAQVHPLIGALAGDANALDCLPEIEVPDTRSLDTVSSPGENIHILDADPSQERAILAARRGQSFVLQGPPGTGKSQTIANIIAACIADGKRVLFVSEKAAALDAVFKRLRDKKLDNLCLEAHSHKANKKEIVEQLGKALNARLSVVDGSNSQRNAAFLGKVRAELNETIRELHLRRAPLGLSAYEANGIVAALGNSVVDLPFVFTSPETVSSADYEHLESLAERLASYHDLFPQSETHPFRGIRAKRFTAELQARVRTGINDLLLLADSLEHQTHGLSDACGLSEEPDADQKAEVMGLGETDWLLPIAALLEETPHPPEAWLLNPSQEELARLRTEATACRTRYRAFLRDRENLLAAYHETIFDLSHDALLERLTRQHEPLLRPALGPSWAEATPAFFTALDSALERVDGVAERLKRGAQPLADLCGIETPVETLTFCRYLRDTTALVLADPRPLAGWFEPGAVLTLQNSPRRLKNARMTAPRPAMNWRQAMRKRS